MPKVNKGVVLGAAAMVAIVVAGVLVIRQAPTTLPAPRAAPAPAARPSAPATPAAPAAPSSPPCAPPAQSAPAPPDGATASADEMRAGHDIIQGYVKDLEAYQACLNAYADHAGPGVSEAQKQSWIDLGNGAVDEANLLAKSFSVQIQAYKATHPGE